METGKIIKYSLIALIVALLTYSGYFVFKQYKLYMSSEFNFLRARKNKITFKGVNLTLFFTFKNETDVNFSVQNQYYDIYLNGKHYKTITNLNLVNIPSKKEAIIPITVDILYKDVGKILLQNITEIATNYKDLVLGVKGHLTINVEGKILQLKDFPIEFQDTIGNLIE